MNYVFDILCGKAMLSQSQAGADLSDKNVTQQYQFMPCNPPHRVHWGGGALERRGLRAESDFRSAQKMLALAEGLNVFVAFIWFYCWTSKLTKTPTSKTLICHFKTFDRCLVRSLTSSFSAQPQLCFNFAGIGPTCILFCINSFISIDIDYPHHQPQWVAERNEFNYW